jgi:hemerythrin-like domain-containing protein
VETALSTLDDLEEEHRRADSLHDEVDMLGKRCLEEGQLSRQQADRFREAVAELASIYKAHIRIEDDVIFPIAGRVLSQTDKQIIAAEMSARRR